MKSFEILKAHLNIHQNYFLEASAGTGKTFAIEHLFVRLLIEQKNEGLPLLVPEILVVTFTKAATIELQARIRKSIERTLHILDDDEGLGDIPDYLLSFLNDPIKRKNASQLIKEALFCFDDAKIFTLHGFCASTIQENPFIMDTPLAFPKNSSFLIKGRAIIKDFLRKMQPYKEFGPKQFDILLKNAFYNLDDLLMDVLFLLAKRLSIDPQPSFFEIFQLFNREISELKERYNFNENTLFEELVDLSVNFSGLTDRKRQLKRDLAFKLKQVVQIFNGKITPVSFDELIGGLYEPLIHFQEEFRLKSSKAPIDLPAYPNLLVDLHQKITPLIERASDKERLMLQFASHLQKFVEYNFKEEEELFYDDLLSSVAAKVKDEDFCRLIAKQYKAVIIDEFQDTDPLQWTIFSSLFDPQKGYKGTLTVVGDPKQSIYAFRNADIYTYLEAQKRFSEHEMARLDVNYRSEPYLIDGLNRLFSIGKSQELFRLPKNQSSLPYSAVKADLLKKNRVWTDGRSALHFFILSQKKNSPTFPSKDVEKELLFPAIMNEIIRLNREENVPLKEMAILVKDRYQADRLQKIADSFLVPLKKSRGQSLVNSQGLEWIKTWLKVVDSPDQAQLYYKILRSPFFGLSHSQLLNSLAGEEGERRAVEWRLWLLSLKDIFSNKGFLSFILAILKQNPFNEGLALQENLFRLKRPDLYTEILYLSEYISEKIVEKMINLSCINELLQLIDEIVELSKEEEHLFQTVETDAVNILTQHMSKGLEFSVVFALGVVSRSPKQDEIITDYNSQTVLLKKDHATLSDLLCEELDAEKIRQFYVVLTRAKSRLYIPFVIDEQNKPLSPGSASPLEAFIKTAFNQDETDLRAFKEWICNHKGHLSISYSEVGPEPSLSYQKIQAAHLNPPNPLKISFSSLMVYSFTSIQQTQSENLKAQELERTRQDAGLESLHLQKDKNLAAPQLYNLPRGTEFGIFLHSLLEKVPFGTLGSLNHDYLMPFTEGTAFDSYKVELVKLLYNTFHAPLNPCLFKLSDLNPQKVFKEMEFLFFDHERKFLDREGLFKGFIDLFFWHEGLYYLLDWKSNDLGPEENYTPLSLNHVLKIHNYTLQATIYTEALKRYLKLVDPRPFDQIFGGVFYLFVRGLNPKNPGQGVAFWKP